VSKLSGRAQWNTASAKLANKPFENLFDDESRECVRCGRPYTEANKTYTRLYGVMCVCGSQEWKDVFIHTCGDCGKELQIVRPGKYQCVNPECVTNKPPAAQKAAEQ
jgi:hypothetical protein